MLPVGLSVNIGEERIDPADGLFYTYNGKEWILNEPQEEGNVDAGIVDPEGNIPNTGDGGTGVLSLPGNEDVGDNMGGNEGSADESDSGKTIVEGSEEAGKLDDEADNMQQMGDETKEDPVKEEDSNEESEVKDPAE